MARFTTTRSSRSSRLSPARNRPPFVLLVAMPSRRFFLLLASLAVMACASYGALVLGRATWAETQQLDALFPFYKWRIRVFSAEELGQAWHGLAGTAAVAGLAILGLLAPRRGRTEFRVWTGEIRAAAARLWQLVAQLPEPQRRRASGWLAALTALRLVLSLPAVTPEYDDVASYELFASKSLLAVAGYYPVPNNHVLANTLSWLFYHLNHGFWFTMRLPVLLAATATVGLLFAGLLWAKAGFRAAGLATLLFSLTNLSLYHAAVGRGYWLLTGLAGVVFFCTLALSAAPRYARAAWSGLVLGSIAGLYTVPTFALVVASAFSWVAVGAFRQRTPRVLAGLLAMGAVVLAGSLLLYAPLLFVSGPASLLANGFISAQTLPAFWTGLPAYLWRTEGALAGQMTLGGLLVLGGLGTALFSWRQGASRPAADAAHWQRLAPAAAWFMGAPYAVLALKHVFAPERTLLYKAFFFFVLLALAIDWLLRLERPGARRWRRAGLASAALLWAGYQLFSLWRDSRPLHLRNQAFHAAFEWLDAQPRGPLLVPEPTQNLFLRMYQHAERPGQPWQLDAFPQTGVAYRYVLAFPDHRGFFQPRFSEKPVFLNAQVAIYRAPPVAITPPAPALPSYWHLAD